jgi:hypothetical protein
MRMNLNIGFIASTTCYTFINKKNLARLNNYITLKFTSIGKGAFNFIEIKNYQ